MKNKILFILVLVLSFSFCLKVSASGTCSSNGYTVLTVNGVFTDEKGAKNNSLVLKKLINKDTYNNQPLNVDYLYNATHLAGLSDLVDTVAQKLFYETSDYDLTNMISDASQKVTTQKLLLVAHSQGNFYANDIYDALASQQGGVPKESIGVYGVASPASRVAGGGKYITSNNDSVINFVRLKGLLNVLKPNADIQVADSGMFAGHDFSNVYLQYQGDRIISEIKSSLDNLKNNDEQDSKDNCISAPKITLIHKIKEVAFAVADPTANVIKTGIVGAYDAGVVVRDGAAYIGVVIGTGIRNASIAIGNMVGGLFANALDGFSSSNSLGTITPVVTENSSVTDTQNQTPGQGEISLTDGFVNQNQETTISDVWQASDTGITHGGQNRIGDGNNGGGSSNGGGGVLPISDTTAPVISIVGSNPLTINTGTVYTDLGATATDDVDGTISVITTGVVNTSIVGTYMITYTATDLSGNIATATRTVNVINPAISDTTPPVITINGSSQTVVTLNSVYVDEGATAIDAVDGTVNVITTGTVDTTTIGNYVITYIATDATGNISTATRNVKVATYKYIPKDSFGLNNGDGHDWQIWSFNGSNAYNWSDTYVNNYLREQFKVQTYPGGFWCSQCLQRGIFKHDPQQGFEAGDIISINGLENNPQNNGSDTTYDVAIQWDSTGYTYTVAHNGVVDGTGHTSVPSMSNESWVGWDGSFNNFQTFPMGHWQGVVYGSPTGRVGGSDMVLQPYPIYKDQSTPLTSFLSLPNKGTYAGTGINTTRGRKNLTKFDFQVIYTDKNNNAPQNVKLHITNTTTSANLSDIDMQKISPGSDLLSDGSFVNGEAFVTNSSEYDIGEYDYYFTAVDNLGNQLRIPENGTLRFGTVPSTYTYIPKYTFGANNGDGNDWQVWSFNGSNAYDWSDTYSNNYLKEQFKIQAYSGGFWCSQCLQRAVFNHDPQQGFEASDLSISSLENNPQNNGNDTTYDVSLQWDSLGYTYTISHGGIIDNTGHTNISNMSNDSWVGWDGSFNNFQTFPSGTWQGVVYSSPQGRTGGSSMVLQPYPVYVYSGPVLSNQKAITTFDFDSLSPSVTGTIDENAHTVSLTVPFGTNVTNLIPSIIISSAATVLPNSLVAQDFTNPVTYTVTAENNSTQAYTVTVTVAPNPNPPPVSLSVTGYTFNGTTGSVAVNPSALNPLAIVINASENVNWMSIKIENDNDHTLYKMFQSDSSGCVDGTNTCTKNWNGVLSSGGLLQSGIYKIKLHIKDPSNNEFYDYLTPYVINVDTSI